MIAITRRKKFCEECRMYGHRKRLWLGTHRTHRMYIRHQINKQIRHEMRDELNRFWLQVGGMLAGFIIIGIFVLTKR